MPTGQTVPSSQGRTISHVLPPELLIEICSINAWQNSLPNDHLQETIRRPQSCLPQEILDTIHASHVCQRWRDILTSDPRLWKNMVDPYDVEWSNMILERSSPLGVGLVPFRGPHRNRDEEKELAMIERLRERLVELHIDQTSRYFPHFPDHFVFSALEVLSLSGNSQLPQTFPGEGTPALRTLHLSYGTPPNFDCVTALSRTLTGLFVIRPYRRRAIGFWGDLMSQLPCLEAIALKYCFATSDYESVGSDAVFQTNVQAFSVHDFAEHLLTFVPRIKFGRSLTRLTVKSHLNVTADIAHLANLESHLIRSFSDKASRVIQHDTLTVGVIGTWVFELHFENDSDYPSNTRYFPSLVDMTKGTQNRWFMDISCPKSPGRPDTFRKIPVPHSCRYVNALKISQFYPSWESLCPLLCHFINLQVFRASEIFVLKFMHNVNTSKHAHSIFPVLRGIYLDTSSLNVWGYRDMFPSHTGSVDDEDLQPEIELLTKRWVFTYDRPSSDNTSDLSDESDCGEGDKVEEVVNKDGNPSGEGDEVEEVVDKDGNRWDDRSFIQEFESISVEQVVNFCKARPSIRFVSFTELPETKAFIILREKLGEMDVELRKHDATCLDMFTM